MVNNVQSVLKRSQWYTCEPRGERSQAFSPPGYKITCFACVLQRREGSPAPEKEEVVKRDTHKLNKNPGLLSSEQCGVERQPFCYGGVAGLKSTVLPGLLKSLG